MKIFKNTRISMRKINKFMKKVFSQALSFQRDLNEARFMRTTFAKLSMRKSMERQSIGSSGYGRFLCSHYNPGASFISSLNNISQKYETKIKQKKRIEKELRKKKELKNQPKINKINTEEKKEVSKEEKKDKSITTKDEKNGKEESKNELLTKEKDEK